LFSRGTTSNNKYLLPPFCLKRRIIVIKKKVRKKSIKITDLGKGEKISLSRKTRAIKATIGEDKAEALIIDKTSLSEM
jgi:hypothetical protein